MYPGGSGMPALLDLAGGGELSSATHFGVDIASCDMFLAMAHRLASHSGDLTMGLGFAGSYRQSRDAERIQRSVLANGSSPPHSFRHWRRAALRWGSSGGALNRAHGF